jgi:defect-in-organelle-trafficking protein DotD
MSAKKQKHVQRIVLAGLIWTAMALSLDACADDTPWSYDSPHPVVATPSPVAIRLADAADKAANALQSLAAVEQTRTPAPLPPITPVEPHDELEKPMTVTWTGPASPLLLRLATRVGYQYEQIGTIPATPVTVTVNVVEQPILEILRDIGMQAGSRANLVVDANRHVVEFEYAPNQ